MPPTKNSAALFGWHSQDSRATGPLDTADTVTAHYGTGGGNTPLIVQPCICIQGSMIGRAEKNGRKVMAESGGVLYPEYRR